MSQKFDHLYGLSYVTSSHQVRGISDSRPSFSAFCAGDAQTQTDRHKHTDTHMQTTLIFIVCMRVCVRLYLYTCEVKFVPEHGVVR